MLGVLFNITPVMANNDEPQHIPGSVQMESCIVEENQVTMVIMYGEGSGDYILGITGLTGSVALLDKEHNHENDSIVYYNLSDSSVVVTNDSELRKVVISVPRPDEYDLATTEGVVIVGGFYDLDINTNKGDGDNPESNACSIIWSDPVGGSYTYRASCNGEAFAPRSVNSNYTLVLDNGEQRIELSGIQGHSFEAEDKLLVFTTAVTASTGQHIDAGYYSVEFYYEGQEYILSEDENVPFLAVNENPPLLSATSQHTDGATDNGIKISCSGENTDEDACRTYLQYIVDHQGDGERPPYDQSYPNHKNSGFVLYRADGTPGPTFFPGVNGDNKTLFNAPQYNSSDGTWSLLIPEDEILRLGLSASENYYTVSANTPGKYAMASKFATIKILAEAKEAPTVETEYDSESNTFLLTTGDKKFLEGISEVWFYGSTGQRGGSTARLNQEFTVRDNGNGTFTALLPMSSFDDQIRNVGTAVNAIEVVSPGYQNVTGTLSEDVPNPYKQMPYGIQIKIIGEGVSIRLLDAADYTVLKEIYETPVNSTNLSRRIPSTRLFGSLKTNQGGPYDIHLDKGSDICTYELRNNNSEILIRAKTTDMLVEGVTDETTPFHMQLADPLFGRTNPSDDTQTVAPMKLYEEAVNGNVHSVEELAALDGLTGTALKNIHVSSSESDKSKVGGVSVTGEAASAIASGKAGNADPTELNDLSETPKTVEIKTFIKDPENTDDIDAYMQENSLDYSNPDQPVVFAVEIEKTSEVSGETYDVTNLPYEAAVQFPVTDEAPEGYHYVLLREHDEEGEVEVKPIEVEVKDGTGTAFTDKFSTFALALEKDPTPKPAPSDDSSKKSSSSGSTKKTSPVKTDNVITCQMAGYPANYAWNESAKACQPGFIDNAGVFHGTVAVNKTGVPNTYDKGLMGNVWALMISVVTGVAAAYALKKY